MITVTVVRLAFGRLVGQSFSDQWNLQSLKDLGQEKGLKLDVNECANRGQFDRLRRTLKGLGFRLRLRSLAAVHFLPTAEEAHAMAGVRPPQIARMDAQTTPISRPETANRPKLAI